MHCVLLLVGVLFHLASGADEPMCSKFAYDEALLEKMIRNEVKFEKLQSEFTELREEVKRIMETFQANVQHKLDKVDENVQAMKQKDSVLNGEVKTILDTIQANVEDKLNTVEERIKGVQEVKQKGESITPMIGFKATDLIDKNPSIGDVLVFHNVLLNEGSGYNNNSGIFTAPVSGIYLLTVQTCSSRGNYHTASIMVQGKEMGRLFTQDQDWSVCNSGNAIAYMRANDQAYIKTKYRTGPLESDSYRMISFAGALLNKNI